MQYVSKHYSPLTFRDAVENLIAKKKSPDKAVVISFDDGYRDNYIVAYPLLKRLNIPAIIFLTAGYIGTEKLLPHDVTDNPDYNRLLSWEEVKKMSCGGIEFGSHTLQHADLGARAYDVSRELKESKEVIERKLNVPVYAISYPYGLSHNFNAKIKEMTKNSGYLCGVSAMNGINAIATDVYELRRIGIESSDTLFTFRAKLNGALDVLIIKDKPPFCWMLRLMNRMIGV
jgi:peptidoglycan/xylan/chitin deacetylase (PgdA/CDA1 family)